MPEGTQGFEALLYAEPGVAPHTFDANSEPYEFLQFTVARRDEILDTGGVRGTLSHHSINTRNGVYRVGGGMVWNPSVADLVFWLPRILGAANSGTSFPLGDFTAAVRSFGLLFLNGVTNHEFTDCQVDKATFRCGPGQLLELALDIKGKTEVIGSTIASAPSLGVTALSNSPFVFSDAVGTFVSTARKMISMEIIIDNMLDVRMSNSRTATSIKPKDRMVTVRITTPYTTDETALYNQSVGGTTGSIVFTNSTVSLTFTFGVLQAPSVGPVVNGKGETVLEQEYTARMTGSTRELVVTLDSTV